MLRRRARVVAWIGGMAVLSSVPSCLVIDAVPAVGTVVGSVFGAYTPTDSIEQIYYLGAYDPLEQLPPAVYRVRVRGQSSATSRMKFGSGWVKADLIDSLETTATIPATSITTEQGGATIQGTRRPSPVTSGRRLVLFGPEGTRNVPRDHRLVVVMGASPESFFQAVDESLRIFNDAKVERVDGAVREKLLVEMNRVQEEQLALARLGPDVAKELGQ